MWTKAVVAIQLFTLATAASTDCHSNDMDVGGSQNVCGYMDVVAVIAADGHMNPSWHDGYFKTVPTEDIDSSEHCQALCEEHPYCEYFAYTDVCILKAGYPNATCTPLYEENIGGVAGPKRCDSCIKHLNDVGGGFNSCGYMPNVMIFAKPNVSKQSWYDGFYVVLPEIETWTAEACQNLCQQNPDCDYWHVSEEHCYLKADYSPKQYANASLGGCVPLYSPFDVTRPFNHSAGPGTCVKVSQSMSCGALKHQYRNKGCCGAPEKMVAIPQY